MTAQATGLGRTFRVFVSSTFKDLTKERNALQEFVFPRLAEYCAARKARFQAIDLRWGVSDEAGLDQRAIAVCLIEIERCQRLELKPNFIVLLGDRYGWRPLPAQIAATEFEEILTKVPKKKTALLVWDKEQPDDAKGWYCLDINAVKPEYVLRACEVDVAEGATPEARKTATQAAYKAWGVTEGELRAILLDAIAALGWSKDDSRMAKYVTSATEQEVVRGALLPEDAHEHVFGFFRSIGDLPTDATAEKFRDLIEVDGKAEVDKEARDRLTALKADLTTKIGESHVFKYDASWTDEAISTDHIGTLPKDLEECEDLLKQPAPAGPTTLCEDVWRSLTKKITEQLALLPQDESPDQEAKNHEKFRKRRCENFVGRDKALNAIADYITGAEPQPLAVVGDGGSGKSALLAKAFEVASAKRKDAAHVVRFVGATPAASDGRSLLDSLCHQIARTYGADESAIPAEYNDLAVEFGKQLEHATKAKPLIVFLDALDQLGETDPARQLSWLPAHLPENVRVVVSTIPGDCEKTLHLKRPELAFLSLDKMSHDEGEEALNIWLKLAGRTLQDPQRKEILSKFVADEGHPLYLKLAFEEARLWRSFIPDTETTLKAGIRELIEGNLFPRLAAWANHGPVLVSHALGYLAASRYGLAEDELIEVLSADGEVKEAFEASKEKEHQLQSDKLPVVLWSRLYFDLEPYLAEHAADGTTLLAFYHRVLGDAATELYLAGNDGDDGKARHSALADYFRGKADPKGPQKDPIDGLPVRHWDGTSVRGLSELPFHLARAARKNDLYDTLTDFPFMERKVADVGVMEHKGADGVTKKTHAGVFALQDDFAIALPLFGGEAPGARKPLIVTGADFGQGLVVRCGWCGGLQPFQQEWRGTDITCPSCEEPLRVNSFIVGESMLEAR